MTETDPPDDSTDDEPTISRRDALAAIAGAAVGSAGAATVAQSGRAASQGLVVVSTARLVELRGPIVDQGDTITQLVDSRAAEDGASISPDPETLVFRYDPNTTV
jgi:hypothetical protein